LVESAGDLSNISERFLTTFIRCEATTAGKTVMAVNGDGTTVLGENIGLATTEKRYFYIKTIYPDNTKTGFSDYKDRQTTYDNCTWTT
jgi:hypothetical protein